MLISFCALFTGACHYRILPYGVVDPVAVERVLDAVAHIRQLTATRPIRVETLAAADLQREVDADLARDIASGTVARQRKAWVRMGLLDASVDLAAAYRRQYSDAPGGYYDRGALKLIVRESLRSEVTEVVGALRGRDPLYGEGIAHELAHALADQHFDIDKLVDNAPDEDARAARRALIEGDASKVGWAYGGILGGSDFGGYIDFIERRLPAINEDDPTPLYLRETFQFPYVYGARFVERVWKRGGWAHVDAAFSRPPASTEQILHPDKFLDDTDPPIAIAPSSCAPSTGWSRIWSAPLGELGVWIWLTRLTGDGQLARAAAAGWGGDRAEVFERGEETALLIRSTWDTVDDARELEAAIARVPTTMTGVRLVERREARVLMVTGAADLGSLLACGWRSLDR